MNLNLPPRDLFGVIRNEVDRFGFSYYLAKKIGKLYPPRAFTSWQHGWAYYEPTSLSDLNWADSDLRKSVVVGNQRIACFLRSLGYRNCKVGGLPFAYVNSQGRRRIENSIVFFPPHSGASNIFSEATQLENYMRYISSFRGKAKLLALCAYGDDHSILRRLLPQGVILVDGAHPHDKNSLTRMRAIFETFEYMSTNHLGSHLLYAAFSGCKISITLPIYINTLDEFRSQICSTVWGASYVERLTFLRSLEYLMSYYSHLVYDDPFDAIVRSDWAQNEIGAYDLLSNDDLKSILGWHLYGQVSGYCSAAAWRVERYIQKIVK